MENITDGHFEIFYLRISALKAAESMKMDTVFMVEYFWSRLTRFLGSWGIWAEANTKNERGTFEELRELREIAASHGVGLYFDAVLNHKTNADSVEECHAIQVIPAKGGLLYCYWWRTSDEGCWLGDEHLSMAQIHISRKKWKVLWHEMALGSISLE